MKVAGTMIRRDEVEFFLRLHGMWEGIIALPPPPDPPYDIETMEPLAAPPKWGWTDEAEAPPAEWWAGEEPAWHCHSAIAHGQIAKPHCRGRRRRHKPQSSRSMRSGCSCSTAIQTPATDGRSTPPTKSPSSHLH